MLLTQEVIFVGRFLICNELDLNDHYETNRPITKLSLIYLKNPRISS